MSFIRQGLWKKKSSYHRLTISTPTDIAADYTSFNSDSTHSVKPSFLKEHRTQISRLESNSQFNMPLFGKKDKKDKKPTTLRKPENERSPTFQEVTPVLLNPSKEKDIKFMTFSEEVAHVDWFHPELTREGAEVSFIFFFPVFFLELLGEGCSFNDTFETSLLDQWQLWIFNLFFKKKKFLRDKNVGDFVLRPSSKPNCYALSFQKKNRTIAHSLIEQAKEGYKLPEESSYYPTLDALLKTFKFINWVEPDKYAPNLFFFFFSAIHSFSPVARLSIPIRWPAYVWWLAYVSFLKYRYRMSIEHNVKVLTEAFPHLNLDIIKAALEEYVTVNDAFEKLILISDNQKQVHSTISPIVYRFYHVLNPEKFESIETNWNQLPEFQNYQVAEENLSKLLS